MSNKAFCGGEGGCDGQAGDKEQGEDGEFGLHGDCGFTSHFAGGREISHRRMIFFLFIRRSAQISADYFEKNGDLRGGAEGKRTGMGDLKRGRFFLRNTVDAAAFMYILPYI